MPQPNFFSVPKLTSATGCSLGYCILSSVNFVESILISLASLRANRLRSLLTLLGIVIGVTTVITVVSFISGLNDYVEQKVFNLGPDVFIITRMPQVIVSFEEWLESQRRKLINLDDMEAVRAGCRNC